MDAARFIRDRYDGSPWVYIVNEFGMRPIGRTLGLGHPRTFPVNTSPLGPRRPEWRFWFKGLPPGDWILVAHPDVEWRANPVFYFERQGDLRDIMLTFPVRAGRTTRGIEINMSRGRTAGIRVRTR